jgi:hypothetical protein
MDGAQELFERGDSAFGNRGHRRARLRPWSGRGEPRHVWNGRNRRRGGSPRRIDDSFKLIDPMLENGIVLREGERDPIVPQRHDRLPAAHVDFRKGSERGEVFGRRLDDRFELGLRSVQLFELQEGTRQRQAGRQIASVDPQPLLADPHRFFQISRAAMLLGELSERDGRRILSDPAPQVFNA